MVDKANPDKNDIEVDENVRCQWEQEQDSLKTKLIVEDVYPWQKQLTDSSAMTNLKYVAGVDLSFVKGDNVTACACLVVLGYPDLQEVYSNCSPVKLTAPYIPGFLAFREVNFLVDEVNRLKRMKPQYVPDVVLVDGNGLLHPKEFGLACHLGVLIDIPCIGVGKALFHVGGLEKNAEHMSKIQKMEKGGDTFRLVSDSGRVLGMALRSCESTTNPIYVSVGHKISLETATLLVEKCCKHRIPEPVRQADMKSREYLRVTFNSDGGGRDQKAKLPATKKPTDRNRTQPVSSSFLDDEGSDEEGESSFGDYWDRSTKTAPQ
ncbi:endonuclease V-like [Tubulanus polymorphus]|uniref:endonuclease V-like n=1 Tax=Tubulanus polymorphus TaxID=672921 RepID=UPI003DA5B196